MLIPQDVSRADVGLTLVFIEAIVLGCRVDLLVVLKGVLPVAE